MSNAVKYSGRGATINLQVNVLSAQVVGNTTDATATSSVPEFMIEFAVADTGIGVPDNKKDKLFKPFAQTQRMAGGTGLGLYSLAKRIEVGRRSLCRLFFTHLLLLTYFLINFIAICRLLAELMASATASMERKVAYFGSPFLIDQTMMPPRLLRLRQQGYCCLMSLLLLLHL
jgi:hypothetical protein